MKVTTDGCLFGAWVADEVKSKKVKVKRNNGEKIRKFIFCLFTFNFLLQKLMMSSSSDMESTRAIRT